ncbi:hypothetical protein ABZ476_29635, partial [Streptomyces albogriseolus]
MWSIVTAGSGRPRAEVCETHTAVLFFAGDRVYKVKKPVDLGFLDYTAVQARRTACDGLADQTGGSWRRAVIEKPFG